LVVVVVISGSGRGWTVMAVEVIAATAVIVVPAVLVK
jgi:hypothetical protein